VSITVQNKVDKAIPQLFQDNLLCAGVTEGIAGSCKGDSGGPLMYKDDDSGKYFQVPPWYKTNCGCYLLIS
jgi:secreted trypsin-like serine protease